MLAATSGGRDQAGGIKVHTLVHDEQRYVEGAVRYGKLSTETLRGEKALITTYGADYEIDEAAVLQFARSDQEIGLQLADVIAGCLARHLKTVLLDPDAPHPLQLVLDRLIDFENGGGLSVNFVATERLPAAAGIGYV